ncbi:MAG: hypothetical protein GY705_07140 [Bacteroidetes bacterium]|nr:hypothetical protein [Bacteroidota bacterium]
MRNYINGIDSILKRTQVDKFRFWFPDFKYKQSKIDNHELDSLLEWKNNLRQNVFIEGRKIKNALWINRSYCATYTGHVVPLKTGVISWPNLHINS